MPPYALDEERQPALFTLSGACTVEDAQATHAALAQTLAAHDAVVLDLGGVDYADITLVQLLLSALQAAQAGNKRLELAGEASPAVCAALRLSGVENVPSVKALFGLPG